MARSTPTYTPVRNYAIGFFLSAFLLFSDISYGTFVPLRGYINASTLYAQMISSGVFENISNTFLSFQGNKSLLEDNKELREAFRWLDVNVNINWPLSHYKSAVRYLQKDPKDIEATGGTNWQKYLPPRFQKRIFYPELWSEDERAEWGKKWVVKEVFNR